MLQITQPFMSSAQFVKRCEVTETNDLTFTQPPSYRILRHTENVHNFSHKAL